MIIYIPIIHNIHYTLHNVNIYIADSGVLEYTSVSSDL